MSEGSAAPLSHTQLHALFDILTHHETYAEVQGFQDPGYITRYGFPFSSKTDATPKLSESPLLQLLLTRVLLPVPGIRNLPPEMWSIKVQGIMTRFGEANLSDSYDKGAIGTRKTLATAASVIHETITRGLLGGVDRGSSRNLHQNYDTSSSKDQTQAWDDCVHELIHGNLVDELFDQVTQTEMFEEHSKGVKVAADYAIIHIASFLHHVFVISPEGQYLLKLIQNVHSLIPYSMIRQTFKISNAATMLNGMIRLLLAKVGIGAISNWMGLTQHADDGMNLLQR